MVVVVVNYYNMYDVGSKTSHTAVTVRGEGARERASEIHGNYSWEHRTGEDPADYYIRRLLDFILFLFDSSEEWHF